MAKIQRRIPGSDLQQNLPEFSGQKINIVKRNNAVLCIYFEALEGAELRGTNMRLSTVKIPVNTIKEVIIDLKATDAD